MSLKKESQVIPDIRGSGEEFRFYQVQWKLVKDFKQGSENIRFIVCGRKSSRDQK